MISSDKILGVYVDNNLSWSDQVKHVCKKISSYIWLLSKIKSFLSQARPHIDYCNIVWGNSCESSKMKIFRLQKRACRVILDYNVEDSYEAMQL